METPYHGEEAFRNQCIFWYSYFDEQEADKYWYRTQQQPEARRSAIVESNDETSRGQCQTENTSKVESSSFA